MEKIITALLETLDKITKRGIRSREDFFYGDSFREREERRVLYNNLFILLLKFSSRVLGYANNYSKVKTLVRRGQSYEEIALDLSEVLVKKLDDLLTLHSIIFIPYITRMMHNCLIDFCNATQKEDVTDSIHEEKTEGFTLEDVLASTRPLIQDQVEYRETITKYIHSMCDVSEPICSDNADFAVVLYFKILGYKAEIISHEIFNRGVKNAYMSIIKELEYYDVYINDLAVVKQTGFTKMLKDPCITSEKLQRKVSQTLNAIKRRFPDEFDDLMDLKASYVREVSKSSGNKAKTL